MFSFLPFSQEREISRAGRLKVDWPPIRNSGSTITIQNDETSSNTPTNVEPFVSLSSSRLKIKNYADKWDKLDSELDSLTSKSSIASKTDSKPSEIPKQIDSSISTQQRVKQANEEKEKASIQSINQPNHSTNLTIICILLG